VETESTAHSCTCGCSSEPKDVPREPMVVERQLTAAERRFQVLAQPPPRFWRAAAAQHFGGSLSNLRVWLLYQRAVRVQDLKDAIVKIEQHFEDGACAGLESRLRVIAAQAAHARACGQRPRGSCDRLDGMRGHVCSCAQA